MHNLFSEVSIREGVSVLAAVGALGYARIHALGALAGKSSESISSSGSATIKQRTLSI